MPPPLKWWWGIKINQNTKRKMSKEEKEYIMKVLFLPFLYVVLLFICSL